MKIELSIKESATLEYKILNYLMGKNVLKELEDPTIIAEVIGNIVTNLFESGFKDDES